MKAVLVFIAALFISSPTVSAQGAQASGVCHSRHPSQWSDSAHTRYRIVLKKGAAEHSIDFEEASSLRKASSIVLDLPPELAASPVELQLFLSRPEQEERLVLEAKL